MSENVSIYGENDRDFHSPFDLGFDPAALETVKWLVLGHLFYLVGLAFAILVSLDMGNVWMTPLFGLPLLWAGRKHREWAKVAVFVILFTAAHSLGLWLATRIFAESNAETQGLVAGAAGGAAGAAGAFIVCAALGLFREGAPTLVFAGFGVLLLAAVGGMGVYIYVNTPTVPDSFSSEFMRMLWIYVPWQLVFAYILAKSLKPVGD